MSVTLPEASARRDQHGRPIDEVTRRGLEIYEGQLRALLEPEHNGDAVAIHVDTGDYAIAPNTPEAMRALRKTHPTGLLFLYTIGPSDDYGLARRMMGLTPGTPLYGSLAWRPGD